MKYTHLHKKDVGCNKPSNSPLAMMAGYPKLRPVIQQLAKWPKKFNCWYQAQKDNASIRNLGESIPGAP